MPQLQYVPVMVTPTFLYLMVINITKWSIYPFLYLGSSDIVVSRFESSTTADLSTHVINVIG